MFERNVAAEGENLQNVLVHAKCSGHNGNYAPNLNCAKQKWEEAKTMMRQSKALKTSCMILFAFLVAYVPFSTLNATQAGEGRPSFLPPRSQPSA